MTTTATDWAILTYDPKETESSVNGTEYTAAVKISDQSGRLYWKMGGLCDYLKKGDTVMVEYIKGKWKIAKTQTPELMKTLEQRRGVPAAPTDAPTTTRQGNGNDVAEMAAIAQQLAAALPEWTEQAIASLACTVFIQRGK